MASNFPSGIDSYTTKIDLIDNVMASHVNDLQDAIVALEQAALARPDTEILADDKVLVDSDAAIQFLDPGGAAREVELPAEGNDNHPFLIVNTADAAEALTVKDDSGGTIGTVARDEAKLFVSNGSVWRQLTAGSSSSGSGSYATILALGG